MINLKHKPLTFFVAGPILITGILIVAGHVLSYFIQMPSLVSNAGLGATIFLPAIMLYLTQIIGFTVLAGVLISGIYKWSTAAIVVNVAATPLVFALIASLFFRQTLDLSSSVGIGILTAFLLMPLIMGVIGYNDIRYRKFKK